MFWEEFFTFNEKSSFRHFQPKQQKRCSLLNEKFCIRFLFEILVNVLTKRGKTKRGRDLVQLVLFITTF